MPSPPSRTEKRIVPGPSVPGSQRSRTPTAGDPASIAFCTGSRKHAYGSANFQ
jgi:hypothetical protein